MTFYGMDVDQTQDYAQRIRAEQQRLEEELARLDAEVGRSESIWSGPDAESFRSTWAAAYAGPGRAVLSGLAQSAHTVDHNVAEQEDASSPRGDGASDGGAADEAADDGRDRGTADPDVAQAWEDMAGHEREAVAQAMVDAEFERYGMEPVEITFSDDISGNGSWREGYFIFGDELTINADRLDDPDILHTLAHEVRHAAQHEFIDRTDTGFWDWLTSDDKSAEYDEIESEHGFTREEIDSWRENFDDYHSAPEEPEDGASSEEWEQYREEADRYLDQPVEVDARVGGREFVEGLTFEDLQDFQREAEVPVSEEPE